MTVALRPVGYWATELGTNSVSTVLYDLVLAACAVGWGGAGLPRAADHVDSSWDVTERAAVVRYLQRGHHYKSELGWSTCRLCLCHNGSREFTDDVYVWPEGFVHYVRDHAVKPPAEFVAHAMRQMGAR